MLLGCIGDDFTGSSDLANVLTQEGMRTVQYCGTPEIRASDDVEAGVVALKSRSIAPDEAVGLSLEALEWLIAQGCEQFFFKYCSTFDSTKEGNIGPVADALVDRLGADRVIVCPAFPDNGRTLYQGYLFVGDVLLSESGMKAHPLTPMTDSDIRRWLGYQSVHSIGHIPYQRVAEGFQAVREALDAQKMTKLIVVDAIDDHHLRIIGRAAKDLKLVTGGSGVAMGLPANFAGRLRGTQRTAWRGCPGSAVILAGSCSSATLEQVAHYRANHPSLKIDPDALMDGRQSVDEMFEWLIAHLAAAPLLYASETPEHVQAAQTRHGTKAMASAIEDVFAALAIRLVAQGVTRLVAAGGETSGAVVEGLDIEALEIGPQIVPGVPAMKMEGQSVALALKSGNFGGPDFFEEALSVLAGADV